MNYYLTDILDYITNIEPEHGYRINRFFHRRYNKSDICDVRKWVKRFTRSMVRHGKIVPNFFTSFYGGEKLIEVATLKDSIRMKNKVSLTYSIKILACPETMRTWVETTKYYMIESFTESYSRKLLPFTADKLVIKHKLPFLEKNYTNINNVITYYCQ